MKRLIILLSLASAAFGQTDFPVTVSVTNTQAALAYTAPSSSPCTVQVSESNTLAPLVNDVNGTLYSGANLDSRPEALTSGTKRIFLIGKRMAETASDTNVYSRALQAYKLHYYKITCGGSISAGSFTTKNIPIGMSYADVPQTNRGASPGWVVPTIPNDRSTTIVDQHTGALIKRVSLDADRIAPYYKGAFMQYGGFGRVCSKYLTGPLGGPQGYLCSMMDEEGGPNLLYFIVPTTGEVRFLGFMPFGTFVNGADLTFFYWTGTELDKAHYSGNFVPSTGQITWDNQTLYSNQDPRDLMHSFDSTFDTTLFNCGGVSGYPGEYSAVTCGRGGQNSYGWLGVFYAGDGRAVTTAACDPADTGCPRIVAAFNVGASPALRWCGLHNIQYIQEPHILTINTHDMDDFGGLGLGTAPWVVTNVNPIGSSDTTVLVSGQPHSLATGGDSYTQNAAVGDAFRIGGEYMFITSITPQGGGQFLWGVSRSGGPASYSAGTQLWAACKQGTTMAWWVHSVDPHGTDATNTNLVIDHYFNYGGHWDYGPLGRISEDASVNGWGAVVGDIATNLNHPYTTSINDSPTFAGAFADANGNTISKHPSYHQDSAQVSAYNLKWFTDMLPYDGGNLVSSTPAQSISGDLYKFFPFLGLNRKQMDTLAVSGGYALVDISGPGSVIGDTSADNYHYCIAAAVGECRGGSSIGDVYVNAPNLLSLDCRGGDGPLPGWTDICVENMPTFASGVAQLYMGTSQSDSNAHSRIVNYGLNGVRDMYQYSTAKALPDASWALFMRGFVYSGGDGGLVNVWMTKLPPLVADDAIDRTTFVRAPINITAPTGLGVATAAVEFGYVEQGSVAQHYCTSRLESCVATAATVTDGTPFSFKQVDTYSKASCATTCTITLPVLPAHVAYWQVKFYDGSGTQVATGEQGVAVENTVTSLQSGTGGGRSQRGAVKVRGSIK